MSAVLVVANPRRPGQPRRTVPLPHLRAWRQWAGISQRQLAARAGVMHATVCLIEQDNRNAHVSTIARLADALGIPSDVCLRCAPSDAEAARWARDVALRFAQERLMRHDLRRVGRAVALE